MGRVSLCEIYCIFTAMKNKETENNEFLQWKVVGDSPLYKKTFDKEIEARRTYGRICRHIEDEDSGKCEMFGRTGHSSNWVLLQEFQLGDYDDNQG